MQKITPFLWFDANAEEAMNFYVSIFPDSQILDVSRYPAESPDAAEGKVMTARIRVAGQELMLLNGGPYYKHTEAFSLFVDCKDQAEVDQLWAKFTENGGEPGQCGWLKDKFGLSWQIVPKALTDYIGGADPEGAGRAMQLMLKMGKIEVSELKRAYEGK